MSLTKVRKLIGFWKSTGLYAPAPTCPFPSVSSMTLRQICYAEEAPASKNPAAHPGKAAEAISFVYDILPRF